MNRSKLLNPVKSVSSKKYVVFSKVESIQYCVTILVVIIVGVIFIRIFNRIFLFVDFSFNVFYSVTAVKQVQTVYTNFFLFFFSVINSNYYFFCPYMLTGTMINSCYLLLRRIFDKKKAAEYIEMFSLRFANVCYSNQKYMMTRLEGFKHILTVVDAVNVINIQSTKKTNYIDVQMLLDWMEVNNIVEKMYNVKITNREIIQRSTNLLRFLVKQNQLTNTNVKSMVDLCTNTSNDLGK